MANLNVYNSVTAQGGRTAKYGDFTVVFMHSCAFATTPAELMQHSNWARGRMSSGNAARDRTTFTDRFETVIARNGSGLRTRGSRGVLQRMIKSMKANALQMEEWSIPHDINESLEIQKKPATTPEPAHTLAGAPTTAPTAAPGQPKD